MTVLIVSNYCRKEDLGDIDRMMSFLNKLGADDTVVWDFSDVGNRDLPDNLEALILSGSTAQLNGEVNSLDYRGEIELVKKVHVPVLGICFGHQLIGKAFGSELGSFDFLIEGFRYIEIIEPNEIFSSWEIGAEITVYHYHKDYLLALPKGFELLARSEACEIEAMKHRARPIYGVQVHIEQATEENPAGLEILRNFVHNVVRR